MRTLWMKSDRKIAEVLIEEGFGGSTQRTADGKRKQLATMQRNVWNDRQWWKKTWRKQARATSGDLNETRGEYLAQLDSFIAEGIEILDDPKTKGTPRVQALSELRQLEQAKAKARGVAETEPGSPDDTDGPKVPFLGVVVGLKKITPAALKKINEWNGSVTGD